MSEEIIKVFDYIGDKLGIAIDYTQENIQPYLEDLWHRFITYEIVVHSIWTFAMLVGIVICSYLIIRYFKAGKKLANDIIDPLYYIKEKHSYHPYEEYVTWRDSGIFLLVAAIAAIVVLTPIIICQISDLIELLIIPEKFVLQLIKTMQ